VNDSCEVFDFVNAEGWYKDPYALHMDRWYSDGKPTGLVRYGRVESHDDPPRGDSLRQRSGRQSQTCPGRSRWRGRTTQAGTDINSSAAK